MRFGCCQMQGRIYSVRPRAVGHPKNWEKSSTICLHTLNRKLMELTRQKKQRGIAFLIDFAVFQKFDSGPFTLPVFMFAVLKRKSLHTPATDGLWHMLATQLCFVLCTHLSRYVQQQTFFFFSQFVSFVCYDVKTWQRCQTNARLAKKVVFLARVDSLTHYHLFDSFD